MPKYLFHASYTAAGMQGLTKDKASGRKAAVQASLRSLGGKLESFYYAFGPDDVVVIADLPDAIAAASMAVKISSSGMVQIRTTPLLTVEEMDKALGSEGKYRPPGA